MLEVRGFRGLVYAPGKAGSPDLAITPPYDVISPEERARLTAASPYSMAHLLLPEAPDGSSPYAAAAERMDAWMAEGVMTQDDEPSFYLLRQKFEDPHGSTLVRSAIFAAVRIPDEHEKIILGHERTFGGTVDDRLHLTEATRANLGAVFGLYPDADDTIGQFLKQMDDSPPFITAKTIDGVRQEFWRVPQNAAITEFFRDKTIYIADGHHRFQTARAYRDQMKAAHGANTPEACDFVLMGLVSLSDPGLKIYPAHRLVTPPRGFDPAKFLRDLAEWFDLSPVDGNLAEAVAGDSAGCAMGVAIHGEGDHLLRLKDPDRTGLLGDDRDPAWRDLDVAVLHRGILERILGLPEGTRFEYEKNEAAAMAAAHEGRAGLGFILRAVRPDQIRACAQAGEPMPQKSTYFFPKLPSGGVIHLLR